MSKKQIRISDPTLLRRRLPEFINRKVNLILKDNTVVFGQLKKTDAQTVYIINMRLKEVRLPVDNVAEFYTDIDA